MKAILFLNGEAPKFIPNQNYDLVMCADGGYLISKMLGISVDIIVGDMDSLKNFPPNIKIIKNPCQETTDFEKCIFELLKRGVKRVDVFASNGKEQDHFMGVLSVASRFYLFLDIRFVDDFSVFFFLPKSYKVRLNSGTKLSLLPFPFAHGVCVEGMKYSYQNEQLEINGKIGIRNVVKEDKISISFIKGHLILWIHKSNNLVLDDNQTRIE